MIDKKQIKEQVRVLILDGQLKEALKLLSQSDSKADTLLANFNRAERSFLTHTMSQQDWDQTCGKLTTAALNMVSDENAAPAPQPEPVSTAAEQQSPAAQQPKATDPEPTDKSYSVIFHFYLKIALLLGAIGIWWLFLISQQLNAPCLGTNLEGACMYFDTSGQHRAMLKTAISDAGQYTEQDISNTIERIKAQNEHRTDNWDASRNDRLFQNYLRLYLIKQQVSQPTAASIERALTGHFSLLQLILPGILGCIALLVGFSLLFDQKITFGTSLRTKAGLFSLVSTFALLLIFGALLLWIHFPTYMPVWIPATAIVSFLTYCGKCAVDLLQELHQNVPSDKSLGGKITR